MHFAGLSNKLYYIYKRRGKSTLLRQDKNKTNNVYAVAEKILLVALNILSLYLSICQLVMHHTVATKTSHLYF